MVKNEERFTCLKAPHHNLAARLAGKVCFIGRDNVSPLYFGSNTKSASMIAQLKADNEKISRASFGLIKYSTTEYMQSFLYTFVI